MYQVDGIPVKGWMIKPRQHQGKLPVLIYNRGGNGGYGGAAAGSGSDTTVNGGDGGEGGDGTAGLGGKGGTGGEATAIAIERV